MLVLLLQWSLNIDILKDLTADTYSGHVTEEVTVLTQINIGTGNERTSRFIALECRLHTGSKLGYLGERSFKIHRALILKLNVLFFCVRIIHTHASER